MSLDLGGEHGAVVCSFAYSQTSLAPRNKPRFIPLRNRAFSSLSTSLPEKVRVATNALAPLRSAEGDGGCISESGTRALCLFSSNPITPRPPSSLGIRINTTTPSPLPSCKPLSQRLRWGVSSNNAGNLPPSLPLSYAACNARPPARARTSRIWPLGVAGTDGVGCILAAATLPHSLSAYVRVSRLHRRQCERGGELFAIIVPSPSPSSSSSSSSSSPSSVSRRPSNEFGNFIYRDRGGRSRGGVARGQMGKMHAVASDTVVSRGKGAPVATYKR